VKKREINIFPLKKIIISGITFFKAFLKDYFAFSTEQLERKMEGGGKS
jgi:hypothetical protein